jgi:hypothetical protein
MIRPPYVANAAVLGRVARDDARQGLDKNGEDRTVELARARSRF